MVYQNWRWVENYWVIHGECWCWWNYWIWLCVDLIVCYWYCFHYQHLHILKYPCSTSSSIWLVIQPTVSHFHHFHWRCYLLLLLPKAFLNELLSFLMFSLNEWCCTRSARQRCCLLLYYWRFIVLLCPILICRKWIFDIWFWIFWCEVCEVLTLFLWDCRL